MEQIQQKGAPTVKPQAVKRELSLLKGCLKADKKAAKKDAKVTAHPTEGAVDLSKGPRATPRVAAPVAQRLPKVAAITAPKWRVLKAVRNAVHSKAYRRALRASKGPPYAAKLAAQKAGNEATKKWDRDEHVCVQTSSGIWVDLSGEEL